MSVVCLRDVMFSDMAPVNSTCTEFVSGRLSQVALRENEYSRPIGLNAIESSSCPKICAEGGVTIILFISFWKTSFDNHLLLGLTIKVRDSKVSCLVTKRVSRIYVSRL